MCLKTVDFALKYCPKSHEYIGEGYKVLSENDIKKYKRKWVEARGCRYAYDKASKSATENSDDGNYYFPGFHIFLNKEDARKYGNNILIKVKFKNVVAFGTNEVSTYKPNSYMHECGPCVIARHMKFVEYCK